jgi:hypothetical protein
MTEKVAVTAKGDLAVAQNALPSTTVSDESKIRQALRRPENLKQNGAPHMGRVCKQLKMDSKTLRKKMAIYGIDPRDLD